MGWRPTKATYPRWVLLAIVGMLVIAMIVTVIIASIVLWTALRASVLMLARAMVVIAATLIRRRRVDQRAGAEHQHAYPCDQTIRDFHVACS